MDYYLMLVAGTWFVSQTFKFLIQLAMVRRESLKRIKEIYLYSSGPPSTHAAVLTASFFFILKYEGINSSQTYIFLIFSVFWIYEIYLQRSRLHMLLTLFKVRDRKMHKILRDYNGHSLTDLVLGIVVGYICFFIYVWFFT